MILTCPQCATRFVVPDQAIPDEGRKVRCAQCSHTWYQAKEEAPFVAPKAVDKPLERNIEGDQPEGDKKKLFAGFMSEFKAGKIAFLAGFVGVLLGYGAYVLMSHPVVMGQGLAFHNVTIERNGEAVVVTGEIVNAMNADRGVPTINITTYYEDAMGDSIHVAPEKEILHSGETMTFTRKIDHVASEVTDIKVGFYIESADHAVSDDHLGDEDHHQEVEHESEMHEEPTVHHEEEPTHGGGHH